MEQESRGEKAGTGAGMRLGVWGLGLEAWGGRGEQSAESEGNGLRAAGQGGRLEVWRAWGMARRCSVLLLGEVDRWGEN